MLSFPMYEKGALPKAGLVVLGDIVLSEEVVAKEAKELSVSYTQRFWELFIHGVLHLLGYDHETDAAEQKMNRKTNTLLHDLLTANKING